MSNNALIKIIDNDIQIAKLVQRDEFLQVLNTEPPTAWVKEHPFNKGVKYLPIEKVELLLTKLFQDWHIEIRESKQLLNSISVTVRLHYTDPIDSKPKWQDGVGAVPAKTEKGARASDMSAILSDAVMTGFPAAKSFAVKDAAESIGKIFGKDLNRRDTLPFTPSYGTEDVISELEAKKEALRKKLEDESTK